MHQKVNVSISFDICPSTFKYIQITLCGSSYWSMMWEMTIIALGIYTYELVRAVGYVQMKFTLLVRKLRRGLTVSYLFVQN
jgi:hypothetical protein